MQHLTSSRKHFVQWTSWAIKAKNISLILEQPSCDGKKLHPIIIPYLQKLEKRLVKSPGGGESECWAQLSDFQRLATFVQPHTTCQISLGWVFKILQQSEETIWRWKRLSIVGSELLQARQMKCITLLGVRSIQTPLQRSLWGYGFELPGLLAEASLASNWYALQEFLTRWYYPGAV